MCSMTLTAALIINLGFDVWCGEMTRRFESCADGIDPKGFFMQMFTAQFGAWLSWATWCGLSVFALLKLCRYHQQENIRVSMAKERKRLINEDLVQEVPHPLPSARDNPAQDRDRLTIRGNQILVEDSRPDLLN